MRFVTSREVGDVLILVIDDPEGVHDDLSDVDHPSVDEILVGRTAPRVAVDLQSIEYLSSAGIAMLVVLRRKVLAAGGSLVLFGIHRHMNDLLHQVKLAPLFPMAEDEGRALALFPPLPAD